MGDCACLVGCNDYDAPEFYQEKTVRARVEHVCYECGGKITPGTRYEHLVVSWEGDFQTVKTCPVCVDLRKLYCDGGYMHGNTTGEIRQFIRDCSPRAPWDQIAKLGEAARDLVLGWVEDAWKESDDE